MTPLVECIPNFSEARRVHVIDKILAVIAIQRAHILDVHMDEDHNRTVITVAGSPQIVTEAMFRAMDVAAEHIDLSRHSGEHPCIGATDVVPFVPLRGIRMAECVNLAKQLGQRVGEQLGLPVFLYEQAATHPFRRNLANIRRGGYDGLQARINDDEAMQPDYGPLTVGPAGAVVIGARGPLIAFNAYLDTDDVSIARQIARQVRESSGGLRFLKAIGVLVDGQAQVSMNLIDFRITPLHAVLEHVREVAAELDAKVTKTELVGLVPQAALVDTALAYLGVFDSVEPLLERRLGAATDNYQDIQFE
jgi:glutamate formiminotransferase